MIYGEAQAGRPGEFMSADDVRRVVARMAHQIVERNSGSEELTLLGIVSRGQHLAKRLAAKLEEIEGAAPLQGKVDPSPYRDDIAAEARGSAAHDQHLAEMVRGRNVVLVDDVLNTGRTARAAIEAVVSTARPARIQLAVLVDRGHRELPIKADYVGKNVPSASGQRVSVLLDEADGRDCVRMEAAG